MPQWQRSRIVGGGRWSGPINSRSTEGQGFLILNRQGVTDSRVNESEMLAIVLGSQGCCRHPTNPFIAESTTFVSYWSGWGGMFCHMYIFGRGLLLKGGLLVKNPTLVLDHFQQPDSHQNLTKI